MLIECIVVEPIEAASDITQKPQPAGNQAVNDEYLSAKRHDIVTKSDLNWLPPAGDTDSNHHQIKGLSVGGRIAVNRTSSVNRRYRCGQYVWLASSKAIELL
jgi:hypothetical protein